MSWPLLVAGLGGLAVSGASNLYSQYTSRKLYRRQLNAYRHLESGYRGYLARNGRSLNPYRAYERYGSRIDSARTNLDNSYVGSLGTVGGTFGAGSMIAGHGLFKTGRSRRWL